MKKSLFAASIVLLSAVGCAKDMDFVTEPAEDLLNVIIPAGMGNGSGTTRVMAGWVGEINSMFWTQGDSIGLFAGAGNVNRKFSLTSGSNTNAGSFSGQMSPVETSTTCYLYYPYVSGATLDEVPMPADLESQVFEGTYDEKGSFFNSGRYSFLVGGISDFTITDSWPEGKAASFGSLMAVLRFKIINNLSSATNVQSVSISSAGSGYAFIIPSYYNLSTGSYSGYWSNCLSTSIPSDNQLMIAAGDTKYVQMMAVPSHFTDNMDINVLVDVLDDGRNVQYAVPKTVSSSQNFQSGKRTTITATLTSSLSSSAANCVKITTRADAASLTAPVFRQGSDYQAASTVWGDGSIERYEAGRDHSFAASGKHKASFNHWGTFTSVTIENLNGISAIDFSNVN